MSVKCPKCHHNNPDDTFYCGKCTTPLKSAEEIDVTATIEAHKEELTTGSTFADRYQIIEEIGKGGMGRVYKVQDTKIKEKIALKLIKPEIAKDKKTIERFSNELRLARKIRHKNVCQMFDLGEEHGTQFITMEYVSGEDLRSSIRRFGQLPIGKSIAIAGQICEGLAEAHRQGVVHRDLKSNNIMIDRDGNVRIMDFGIARSLETKGITGAGMMIGTPEYMSPEQVEGKEVDYRSDVYSLGIILYEMVTGRLPFEGDTPFTVGVKQKSEIPQHPKELNSQIPDDLNSVILRCLEKEKESRYQSSDEVHSELSQIEKGIPTTKKIVPPKKPLTSREITVTLGVKKLLIPALAIIAVIITGIILWQVLHKQKATPLAPSDRPSLAVMYFENNTGDVNLDHYRKAISDLLITDLNQSKYLEVLSGAKLFNILDKMGRLEENTFSSETLEEVASRARVRYVIVGSYSKAGDVYRLNYSLLDGSNSDIVGTETVQGRGEESIFTMVDEITRKIKSDLDLSAQMLADDFDRDIGKITTRSPEAYKYYIEGRDYHNKGEGSKSIASMEKAIAIDPEFAMAYRSMAMSYSNDGYASEKKKYLEKAFELTDRLSERERLLIQGQFYGDSENTYGEAIEAYEKLLELYPKDSIGNVNLGMLYANLEEWDKAIEFYNVPILNNDDTIFPYFQMADAYEAKGLYDKAKEVLERYRDNFSDDPLIHYSLALNYLDQGKFEPAQIELDKALSSSPRYYIVGAKGDLHLYRGDLERAEKVYRQLLEDTEISARIAAMERLAALYTLQGRFSEAQDQFKNAIELADNIGETAWKYSSHFWLAQIYLKTGNPEDALKELEKALEVGKKEEGLDKQKWILLGETLVHVETKSLDVANNTKDELENLIRKGKNQRLLRYIYLLNGKIELERENYSEAIEQFEKAKSFLSFQWNEMFGNDHAEFFYSLATAYFKAGELEKARLEFEKTTKLTVGRLWDGDIYAKSFYMLGKINEEMGDTTTAIANYEKFLDLWKDADPDLPEVDDARTKLSTLKNL